MLFRSELPDATLIELKLSEAEEKFRFTATISGSEKPELIKSELINQKAKARDWRIEGIKLMFIKTADIEASEELLTKPDKK